MSEPTGLHDERVVHADIRISETKHIHVCTKTITGGGQSFGTYAEVSDYVLQEPVTDTWAYVQGIDIPLSKVPEVIAGLQSLHKAQK